MHLLHLQQYAADLWRWMNRSRSTALIFISIYGNGGPSFTRDSNTARKHEYVSVRVVGSDLTFALPLSARKGVVVTDVLFLKSRYFCTSSGNAAVEIVDKSWWLSSRSIDAAGRLNVMTRRHSWSTTAFQISSSLLPLELTHFVRCSGQNS